MRAWILSALLIAYFPHAGAASGHKKFAENGISIKCSILTTKVFQNKSFPIGCDVTNLNHKAVVITDIKISECKLRSGGQPILRGVEHTVVLDCSFAKAGPFDRSVLVEYQTLTQEPQMNAGMISGTAYENESCGPHPNPALNASGEPLLQFKKAP